jgi:hypothetical protein
VEKTAHRGALLRVLLTKYASGDKNKKNEMGRACSTYEVQEVHAGFWWGEPEGKRPLDLGVNWRIILK